VAASAAILSRRGTGYEMARPGLSLFGVVPAEYEATGSPLPISLRAAMTVRARAERLEWVPPGTRVGYGGTFETAEPTLLALLPLGYADGLRRNLGNERSSALHRGSRFQIVGRVSMDSCVVDATAAGEGLTRESVWTIVGRDGGESITIEEVARLGGTVPQEILVGFDDRLPIVYRSTLESADAQPAAAERERC
jgi:alanine racemase